MLSFPWAFWENRSLPTLHAWPAFAYSAVTISSMQVKGSYWQDFATVILFSQVWVGGGMSKDYVSNAIRNAGSLKTKQGIIETELKLWKRWRLVRTWEREPPESPGCPAVQSWTELHPTQSIEPLISIDWSLVRFSLLEYNCHSNHTPPFEHLASKCDQCSNSPWGRLGDCQTAFLLFPVLTLIQFCFCLFLRWIKYTLAWTSLSGGVSGF